MKIAQLPPQLANQIAAGEVVERPASVVKELVENSLDAGATTINIDIEKGGGRRIRIRDNGAGISRDQLTLALSRHATSKIACLDDLEAIYSLGFRGEALASISSVSRLTLTSKPPAQAEAWQAFCEGREMSVRVEPASHPDGTTVDVEDLFYNTPARRKFLRTEKTEFGHISEVVRRMALAYPEVRFQLTHNHQQKQRYTVGPAEEAQARRMLQVGGRRFAAEALTLSRGQGDYQLSGWLARPEHCHHQNDLQYMYVNGRMMRDRVLSHAVRQAYGELLGPDRQPTYILYFELPPGQVDVNVHPAKHEVRFHQSRQVHDFMLTTLKDALSQAGLGASPVPVGHAYQPPDPSQYSGARQPAAASYQPSASAAEPVGTASRSAARPQQAAIGQHSAAVAREGHSAAAHTWQQLWQTPLPEAQSWQPLTLLRQQWLLLQKADDLALLPVRSLQQGVQEQRLYQQFEPGLTGQPLLLPTQLHYQGAATVLAGYAPVLEQLGLLIRQPAADHLAVLQVPAVLRECDLSSRLAELLDLVQQQPATIPLRERTDVLTWLAAVNCLPAYSPDQAKYWWQQATELALDWTPDLQPLAWEPR